MLKIQRSEENPVLIGKQHLSWEAEGAYNGCPVKHGAGIHLLYRAQSSPILHEGFFMELSTIGHAYSRDGLNFKNHRQLIVPEHDWEKFGCEDPRVIKMGNKYFIFYTALSDYPFSAEGIKVGVAITKDFKKIEAKHLVTPFNAKAMAIFPEKINGQIVGILTANTDLPPSKIGLAFFDKEEQLWSKAFWNKWYENLESHVLRLGRNPEDHIEMGAPPIKTKKGWLIIYSYVRDYFNDRRTFGIEAVLLDLKNPRKILGRTDWPILAPEEYYEIYGKVPRVVFPSGVLLKKNQLHIYYGATDTTCAVAICSLDSLLDEMLTKPHERPTFKRFQHNPIISAIPEHDWENKTVFNPGTIKLKGKIHLLYRALNRDDVSTLGYASTKDGYRLDERLKKPVYVPRESFEIKQGGGYSGCEDARLTKLGSRIYMCYTAVNGANCPRVAFTSIKAEDFANKKWNWTKPVLISPPDSQDKDACLFPEKINGKFVFLHRLQKTIDISFFNDLKFKKGEFLTERPIIGPRPGMWDDNKVGINTIPLKTKAGWLLLYHGVSLRDNVYRLGAFLLDLEDPAKVLAVSRYPIFEPKERYEKEGLVPNVVFPCGMETLDSKIFMYYGGADEVIGGATIRLKEILKALT